MRNLKIKDWKDICDDFKDADLLLGNGFSMNIDRSFSYDSLFESFLEVIGDDYNKIIEKFGTNNFEFIVQQLNNAERVNNFFGIETGPIKKISTKLREGLIKTVNQNHPRWEDINWNFIDGIAKEIINQFSNIFSLNYDIYLYHIILRMNDLIKEHGDYRNQIKFGDGFWQQIDNRYHEFPGFQDYNYRMVYYLHGALFIFKRSYSDLKLIRGKNQNEILELISRAISKGNIPLFVSEGGSSEKKDLISRSTYLNYCMRELRYAKNNLVIYGASLASPDLHISDAINNSSTGKKKIAYSIYQGDSKNDELLREVNRIESLLYKHDITFFDSEGLFSKEKSIETTPAL